MNNLLRAREITWFLVGITSMLLAFYTYFNNDKGQAGYFVILSAVSAIMFYLRRKHRKELESDEKKDNS
jgi:hypothetical protein